MTKPSSSPTATVEPDLDKVRLNTVTKGQGSLPSTIHFASPPSKHSNSVFEEQSKLPEQTDVRSDNLINQKPTAVYCVENNERQGRINIMEADSLDEVLHDRKGVCARLNSRVCKAWKIFLRVRRQALVLEVRSDAADAVV